MNYFHCVFLAKNAYGEYVMGMFCGFYGGIRNIKYVPQLKSIPNLLGVTLVYLNLHPFDKGYNKLVRLCVLLNTPNQPEFHWPLMV